MTEVDPRAVRAEFEQLVAGDLHGPAHDDPHEVLVGSGRVRDRYILGLLAPRGTVAQEPARSDDEAEPPDGALSSEASAPRLFPSSIGLSFVVEAAAREIEVIASWGKYTREDGLPEGFVPPEGDRSPDRHWLRHPMGGTVLIPLRDGPFADQVPTEDEPQVRVRGNVRQGPGGASRLVTVFLVNEQDTPAQARDVAWLFQVSLAVRAPGGAPVILARDSVLGDTPQGEDPEVAALEMQYRDRVEFAVGHGTAVGWQTAGDDPRRAVRLTTTAVPRFEVAATEAPRPDELPGLDEVELDMQELANIAAHEVAARMLPLVTSYEMWIEERRARLSHDDDPLADHRAAGERELTRATQAAARLRAGISLLEAEPDALESFRFANHAMWQQRVHSIAAGARRTNPNLELAAAVIEADLPENHRWRPFQLAFLLLNLPALTDPRHEERVGDSAQVDLLFFPTGGGKTEAYLGLAAYTFAIRRLQGTVGDRDGRGGGVAVLMRYTLRLLTAQQFQRAAALVCACEVRRKELITNDPRWGETPFRLGMWVGANVTPNWFHHAQQAIEAGRSDRRKAGGASEFVQLVSCPWCGTELDPLQHAHPDPMLRRSLLFCGESFGECAFTEGRSGGEGIPVVTVDEEIYRLLPAMVIATVDKFAQLPWQGPLHLLFGRVRKRCERHGYRSADLDTIGQFKEADRHNRYQQHPEARTVDVQPLRPPDLIIQDELHLISGPLGTMVGLYETAIDRLASWQVDGTTVRPKVIASTATIRRAREQVLKIFARKVAVFPPPGTDVDDTFFARQRPTEALSGRLYLGICAPGQRLKAVETRVATTLLAAGQTLFERYGEAADPYMTMVGYFSALRELAGMRRIVDDDVRARLPKAQRRGFKRRRVPLRVEELTSRMPSGRIKQVLDQLDDRFLVDPPKDGARPIDVVLATNMISVGVDVSRLGLMLCVGQPKATAEYIQATSRVGRTASGPGLVVTIYNWARPRDLSHYERFGHYHSTYYRHVEPLSVTPFSKRALDRGLTALIVALARHASLDDDEWTWNPNSGAQVVDTTGDVIASLVAAVTTRAEQVEGQTETVETVQQMLDHRLERWKTERDAKQASTLSYRPPRSGDAIPLLHEPGDGDWTLFTCPMSMRETEINVNLLVDEADSSLAGAAPVRLGGGAPNVALTAEDDDAAIAEEAEPVA